MQRIAREKGKVVPDDIMGFMEAGDLVLLDGQNERVLFDRAVVTWDG